jgi:hypothetical protein
VTAYTVAAVAVTYVSAIVPWVFVVLYHVMSGGAWRRDPMGRHIMALTAVDGSIFTMVVLTTWWPTLALDDWFKWSTLAVIAGIPLVTAWRGRFLWYAYHPKQEV